MVSHSLPGIDGQRPGETDAEFAARLMALLQEAQRKNEEVQQQMTEVQRRMEKLPFLLFVDHMEDLVFSSLLVERAVDKVSGQKPTDVGGKLYPRSIRPWADFVQQHAETFDTLRDTLGNEPRFQSSFAIETIREGLCRRPRLANETDTRHFVDLAIETPVAEILTEYLNTIRPDVNRVVHFQSNAYKKLLIRDPLGKPTSPTKELQPDRWCFVYELIEVDGEVGEREDKTVNILVGEIKPPFKLKAPTLAKVLSTMRHDTFFQDAIKKSLPPEGNDAAEEPTKRVPGHVLVAHALCQAYHYMIGSGCQYGYIASGESLVLLRVDDDRSLFYHFISFQVPAVRNAEGRRQQNRGLRQPHETAVAYLASLCVWAVRATPRSFTWIDAATETALRWPIHKKTGQKDSAGVLGIHRPDGPRPEDDDGAGGGEDSTGNSRPPTIPNIAMPSRLQKRGRSPEKRRQGEQSQRAQRDKDDVAEEAAALALAPKTRPLGPFPVEPPTLPYCTQACLRGLVRGQALDNSCPNVALHRDARLRAESRVLQSGIYSDDLDPHPLTASALRARMVVQLAVNMDKDCQCLAPHTGKARYAKFFKLAVTGYGYTFVGKGVRAVSRKVLEHEAVVYNAVPQLQGFLIPVFLGIIDLERPLPMPDMVRIAHIMLMSYAGLDFTCPHRLPSHVDTEWESDRTTMDLERAGIYNPDVREANVAWNAEVQRVMHFDFDRVSLDCLPDPPTDDEEDQAEPVSETKRVKTEPDAAASGARSPLLSRADANAMDGAVDRHDDDLAKKTLPKAEKVEQCE